MTTPCGHSYSTYLVMGKQMSPNKVTSFPVKNEGYICLSKWEDC